MNLASNSAHRVRTGLFEIDLGSCQVLKEGRSIPVQDQPFRVLAALLERPGVLISREELRNRIWPADTYVGFDEGLNTAIRKLRLVFGDAADNPRFIETIPRRGYRFIAPITVVSGSKDSTTDGGLGSRVATLEETASDAKTLEPKRGTNVQAAPRSLWKAVGWTLGAVVLGILVFVSSRMLRRAGNVAEPTGRRAMLAVLPFQNLTNDPQQEYFSDGLTEETITDLGQLNPEQLGVIARTSAMAYKHTSKTIAQIGRELGVDYVLEGSVRRENGRARVSAQLIRVADQTHLWAENYDSAASSDLLDVQDGIGEAIAEQVRAEITPEYKRVIASAHAKNPEAYDLYLKGRFYWNQRTPASIAKSIDVLQQAIKADPNFADAYAGLADAYNISNIVGLYSAKDSLPRAKDAASKAIELNPALADAHAALGMALSHYDFDFPGAQKEFLKALELNPNSAYAHLFYSNCYLLPMGLSADAIAENKKAIKLDPLSLPINNFLGMTYLYAKDYAAAEKQFRSTIAMDPNFPLSHAYLSFLYEILGRYPEAIDESEKANQLSGSKLTEATARAARLRTAYQRGGKRAYWLERIVLDEELMKGSSSGTSPVMLALDAAMAGEKEKALRWLSESYEAREGGELTLLSVDPDWDNLRDEGQFTNLLRRIRLPINPGQH